MSSRKILLLAALVLLLFGFIFLFERKMPTTTEADQKKDLVWELPEDRIESVRLERPGSVPVELTKTSAGAWRVSRPEPYPADAFVAGEVVSQLAKLHRTGSKVAEAGPEGYGFAPPSARATVSWKDPERPGKTLSRTVEFGVDIPGTDAVAARVAGTPGVFFVPAAVAAAVRKDADEFRSKDVFGGSAGDVVKVDIERGRGKVALAKKGGVWWLDQPVVDLADGDFAQRFVDQLTALKAVDFLKPGERENLAALGLAPPLYRVTLSDGKTPVAVEFGATRSDGNTVYAHRESQVFTVPSSIVEDLSREAVVFREPRLVRFDRAALSAVEGVFGGDRIDFEKKDSGWSFGKKSVSAASADDLMSALLEMKSRSFLDEGAAAALKTRAPAATVTLRLAAGEAWTVQFFPVRQDTEALVSGRPGAFAVAGDAVGKLRTAFKKAAGEK
jgi:hypothetical protein